MNYAKYADVKITPQSAPIPGSDQVENSAGGFTWAVDDWTRLERFLILGSEGGSYYARERELTLENAAVVERCLALDPGRTIARISEISTAGRAPKNDPAIFALALALKKGPTEYVRRLARAAVPSVCRTGTHIFQLAQAVKHLGGWGRNTKKAIAAWYTSQPADALALNLIKYQSRNGWSHRDLLRLAHVKPSAPEMNALYRYAVGKVNTDAWADRLPQIIHAFETLKANPTVPNALFGIGTFGLPRECIPTELLGDVRVWDALLRAGHGMPLTAMIRNLGKMSAVGLLKPNTDAARFVASRLVDRDQLKRARVHPLSILIALKTYAQGHGERGSLEWTPVRSVVDALDDAFKLAFDNVEPTGKRWLLGIDISGSMDGGSVAGSALTPREAAAAMALVTARTERDCHMIAFTSRISELSIGTRDSLATVVAHMRTLNMGDTDCAMPMRYALEKQIPVDTFVVYTDSETWAGPIHPVHALRTYRQRMGIPAKLVVCGMVSNGFTIADPNDAGMLDVVGFDTATPAVISAFARD